MSDIRKQAKKAASSFRGAWVELGRLLNEVAYGGDYKEWGYDDFEAYCARELGLGKPTVQKIMVSYNYMKKYEAKRLRDSEDSGEESGAPEIPDFQTVEILDRIRTRTEMPEEEINELHRRAFEGGSEEPEFRKELRQHLRPQSPDVDPDIREKAKILTAARKLRREISNSDFVPEGLRERIEAPLVELEALD